MTHQWREPILRLFAIGPLRYREVKERIIDEYNPAPLDGQVSKVLGSLGALGYIEKAAGKRSPWNITVLGKRAISVLDHAYRGGNADRANPAPTVDRGEPTRYRRAGVHDMDGLTFDTTRAHSARRYDYWLCGKNHFEADRISGQEFEALFPTVRLAARENRDFLGRAVHYLTARAGIRQFLDIGPGLPTANNTHEVAQNVAPDSRVVYVDNDPMVLRHAQALLTSRPEGKTAYIGADLRDPQAILNHPFLASTLDLSQPVGLMLVAVLHFIHGKGAAKKIVDTLLGALPTGSFLVVSHGTQDLVGESVRAVHRQYVIDGKTDVWPRDQAEFATFFDGLDLVDPGIVQVSDWRRDLGSPTPRKEDVGIWAAVARKP
ncbi:SAM-dependent methyltransferase [Actinoplanes sp. NPDC026619]|uniref:SAM-dependent methyltransferase n=1 Tax=Actinoplanes sp. NPDC026619 TaxID=3155798 RepID=UPI0033CCB92C